MAQTIFIAGGPKRRIPVYIMKKFDFVQLLEAIQKYKITMLSMVPPIVVVRQPHALPQIVASSLMTNSELSEIMVLTIYRCLRNLPSPKNMISVA